MSFKRGSKPRDTFESWESLLKKTLSKDGLLNFVKPVDNPIHWIHLLDPFDNQASPKTSVESRATSYMDLSSWPLIPFSKVQLLKCEKCCLEFCSPVNHRRHLRMIHRRGATAEKENARSQRQQLATFWDALSAEEAGKIVDVKNLVLEDLVGEKVVKALSNLLRQPALLALPHSYVKSGAMLLELVQRSSSKPLLSSSELFKIFDGSSEKTFPSFGLNVMHRYIFEGGAGKVGLEAKNLVSSLGLLVELNLVKAFIKDKDEEAQRCQTALVEEEEAFQRKQAQLQERKRLKKARQKDGKEKEQKLLDSAKAFLSPVIDSSGDDEPGDTNLGAAHEAQSKSSPNAFENLYNTLAGEEADADPHLPVHLLKQGSQDDGQFIGPEVSDDSSPHSESVSTFVTFGSQETVKQGSVGFCAGADIADLEHEGIGGSAKGSLDGDGNSEKFISKEKRKYPSVQSAKVQDIRAPFGKLSWREKDGGESVQKTPGHTVAHSMIEFTELARHDVCPWDFSENRQGSYQNRQVPGKLLRARKYPMAGSSRTAVWAKKALKCSETQGEGVSDHTSAGLHQSKVEDAAVDRLQEFVPSTIMSPLASSSGGGCAHQSNAAKDENICSLESYSSAILAPDLGGVCQQDQAADPSSPCSPDEMGSLVIGSVRVSLSECVASQDQRDLLPNTQDGAAKAKILDVPESEPAEPVNSLGKVEESLRTLNENGAVCCLHHKEFERAGKALRSPLQVDLEEKENHEHPMHETGEVKSGRPVTGQAGSRGGRVKIWRPVVSTSSHVSTDSVDTVAPANSNTVVFQRNQSTGADLYKSDNTELMRFKELEQGHLMSENDCNPCSLINTANKCLVGHVVGEANMSASAFQSLRGFLSERWSAVANSSDTVVLNLEDEEKGERQNERLCEETAGVEELMCGQVQMTKESPCPPGNEKSVRGLWKEGCSGSAMAANRHFSGKNCNFHVAPRLAVYRYVPK